MGDFHAVDGTLRPGLAKLRPSGQLDESFNPVISLGDQPTPFSYPLELRNGLANRLVSSQSRGFSIVSDFTGPYTTCARVGGCGPPSSCSEVRWFNEIGGESGDIRINTTLGTPVSILVRTSFDALVLKGSTFSLQSTAGDRTVLTEMSETAPRQLPLFPFIPTSLDLLGAGPLFQRPLLIGGTQKFTFQGQPEPGHHRAQLTTTSTIQKAVPQADGSYFISGNFFELSPSGEILRNHSTTVSSRSGSTPNFHLLQDQSIILSDQSYGGIISFPLVSVGGSYRRLLPDGELDSTWSLTDPNQLGFAISSQFGNIRHLQSGSRNKLYLFGQFTIAAGPQTVIRLHSTGQIDHSFCPPPIRTSTAVPGPELILTSNGLSEQDPIAFSHPVIPATSFIQDDKLIVFGIFDQPARNLAALTDSHTTGFREWITATTGAAQDSLDDFDGDGTNNFGEYALGTHPAFADQPDHHLSDLPPRVFGVPCNPEALEVTRRIEVSADLANWRPATPADLTLETRSDCFRYRVHSQAPTFFSRVVTESHSN